MGGIGGELGENEVCAVVVVVVPWLTLDEGAVHDADDSALARAMEDGELVKGQLSRGNLSLSIDEEGAQENAGEVGPLAENVVENSRAAAKGRQAAALGFPQAEEADEVRAVRVEGLRGQRRANPLPVVAPHKRKGTRARRWGG